MGRFNRKHPNVSAAIAYVKVWWSDWQLVAVTWFLFAYLVVHLPGVRNMADLGWFDLNFLLPIVLFLILWQSVEIARRLEAVETGVRGVSGSIESVVLQHIESVKKPKHRTLDVLGLNLRYGWQAGPRRWIDDGQMDGWTVHLCAYLPDASSPWVPRSWPAEAESNLKDVLAFGRRHHLKKKSVTVTPYAYAHTPPVHGYRFGNGDIYMAHVSWDGDRLSGVRARYEFVPHADRSPHAVAMRSSFASWLVAAKACQYGSSPTPPTGVGAGAPTPPPNP
jgi:hypothetical protein